VAWACFSGITLSHDARTLELAYLAGRHMVSLEKVRCHHGHSNLIRHLLAGILSVERSGQLRDLWTDHNSLETLDIFPNADVPLEKISVKAISWSNLRHHQLAARQQWTLSRGYRHMFATSDKTKPHIQTTLVQSTKESMVIKVYSHATPGSRLLYVSPDWVHNALHY